jgi:hypothetical protein
MLTPEPVQQGTRFRGHYARAGLVMVELAEFERPGRVTFGASSPMVDFDDEVLLTGSAGRTRVVATMTARPKGMMRLMSFLMQRMMEKQFPQNWQHLKTTLEQ